MNPVGALCVFFMALGALTNPSSAIEIDKAESLIAVVTHRGGVAASKAHNHLIVAGDYEAQLTFAPETPLEAQFELALPSEALVADDPEIQQDWYPRLETLGVLDEPFSDVSDKDRAKIRKAMLSSKQLDSTKFPSLEARVTSIVEQASTVGEVDFPYLVTLELTVRGAQVSREIPARFEVSGDVVTIEAVGAFAFTDFGIKPYSAALGLVKNLDTFHVYLHLEGGLSGDSRPSERQSAD